jgi:hypothetical protein
VNKGTILPNGCVLLCCAVLCCAVLCCVVSCRVVLCHVVTVEKGQINIIGNTCGKRSSKMYMIQTYVCTFNIKTSGGGMSCNAKP